MSIKEDPELVDALDGLINAANYADSIGEDELCYDISNLYQLLGRTAPEEEWE